MKHTEKAPWTTQDSAELYGINRWGNDYFGLSKDGKVTAKTLHSEVPILDIIDGMNDRGLQMPVVVRIENILDAQIYRLNMAFRDAIDNLGYKGQYRGVYPIKVNQQAQVVEEIAHFGARFHHGFEVGSKPEMIAALSTLEEPGSLIVCNGYKDEEFIDLGLRAIKLGFMCFFVIETPSELEIIIDRSRQLGVSPLIGVRVKMTTKVSGHWNTTSGDRSVFGLTTTQLIDVIDTLKEEGMLDCLKLLHCHLGSQIPNIQDIRNGIAEACRFYADIKAEGADLSYIDLGGGLAVDYSGAERNEEQSRNYTLQEYCEDIVDTLRQTFDQLDIPHPTIVTESGRATVAYSSLLLFNILDTNTFEPIQKKDADPSLHPVTQNLFEIRRDLSERRLQENYNDAHYYRNEAREQFRRGLMSLRTRSQAENIFLDIMHAVVEITQNMEHVPQDLEGLKTSLADIYYGNFSLFQSLPDIWAIDQQFPIMPIHRLDEEPTREAVIADITCDCDGKIDRFIGRYEERHTLALHELKNNEEYYLGVFLVGAYQETLGDLHNLFGDTNVVSVRINGDNTFEFVKEIHGDTIADVLSYVEFHPKTMITRYRDTAERAVQEGRITARERTEMINSFNESMRGYTYYEKED